MAVVFLLFLVFSTEYCTALEQDLFGLETPYLSIQGHDYTVGGLQGNELMTANTTQNTTCSAIHMTTVFRHGARFPSFKEITGMDKLHDGIKHRVGSEYGAIRNWRNQFSVGKAMELSWLGGQEQQTIGARYGIHYHSLLKNRSASIQFISSRKQRSIQSSVRFNRGLQSILLDRISLNFTPQVDDHLLRFYDGCQLFQKSVLFNLTAHRQTLLFENGNLLRNISEGISRKMMNGSYLLNPEDVILMAKYCAYEFGLYGASVWCDIFEDWQQPVFEYLIDLEKYWGWSYGNRINYEQSCPLISNIFHNMDKFVTLSPPADRYTARFLFGHAETILPLVTALGLFEDTVALRADNFNSQTHRKFVVSKISPFAANVAFVVYKCDQTNPDQGPDFRIKVQVNEKDVHVPGYDGPLYPYQMLRNRLARYVDQCDFENLCKLNPDQTAVG